MAIPFSEVRPASLKMRVMPAIPTNIAARNFLTVSRAANVFTMDVDYTKLVETPIQDSTTSYAAVYDSISNEYKRLSVASIANANGGDVVGPSSAVNGNIPLFGDTSGKLIRDGGKSLPSGDIVGTTDTQTISNKTLSSPTLTGIPVAPTATLGTNTSQLATTAFVIANGGSTGIAVYNVLNYGADPTGATSSKVAINAAIRAAGGTVSIYGTGGIVWIPEGNYDVSGGLDLTNIQNSITIRGAGITSTILRAVTSTNAILDMTGTASVTISNLNVNGQSGNATYGVLLAHSSINANDVNFFENVSFIGAFYIPIYIYGGSDGQFNKMSIQGYNPSSPALIYISNTNDFVATSIYATIGTGSAQAGDWLFFGSDLHDLSTFSPAASSTVAPIYINGSMSPIKFIGGVVGAPTNAASAGVFTINTPSGVAGGISIIGMQFYGDNGIGPGCLVRIINSTNGLVIQGCNGIAGSAYLAINSGATLSGANITGNNFAGTTTFATMFSGNCTITGSIIDAQGFTFNMGSGGAFTHNVVTRPGAITATTQSNNGLF